MKVHPPCQFCNQNPCKCPMAFMMEDLPLDKYRVFDCKKNEYLPDESIYDIDEPRAEEPSSPDWKVQRTCKCGLPFMPKTPRQKWHTIQCSKTYFGRNHKKRKGRTND